MPCNTLSTARPTGTGAAVYSAALFTLGAAAIHLALAPAHFREYVPFGVFFLLVGSAQAIYAIELAVRPTRRLALLMAAGSAGLIGLWVLSRTVGLPVGPYPGEPEDLGLADGICNVLEVVAMVLFAVVAFRTRRRVRSRRLALLGAVPSGLVALGVTTTAVAAVLNSPPEAVNVAPPVSGESAVSVERLTEQPGDEPVKRFTLAARVADVDGEWMWTFNGTVPGPELHVTRGDRVQVTLINELPESTTVHWHGVSVPNAEDGVAGITQDAVQPGQTFTYEFVARDAGTDWYHSHQRTEQQVARGLFGALVVEPPEPTQDRDVTLVLHGEPGHVRVDRTHIDAQPGETVRLRLINAVVPGMDGGPQTPVLIGAPATVEAVDGHELHQPQPLGPTRIPLGIGQRADLVFTMPATNSVQLELAELRGQPALLERVLRRFVPNDAPSSDFVRIGSGPAPEMPDLDSTPLLDLTTMARQCPPQMLRSTTPRPSCSTRNPASATAGLSWCTPSMVRRHRTFRHFTSRRGSGFGSASSTTRTNITPCMCTGTSSMCSRATAKHCRAVLSTSTRCS
jgi:FtsP/CotA-like multicopper oxidase with cupredoxin domain